MGGAHGGGQLFEFDSFFNSISDGSWPNLPDARVTQRYVENAREMYELDLLLL